MKNLLFKLFLLPLFINTFVSICYSQNLNGINFGKLPQDYQLYPRRANNSATFEINGKIIDNSIKKISYKAFRNNELIRFEKINVTLNETFNFTQTIIVELAEYKIEIYRFQTDGDSSLVVVRQNIVAGDTYLITGQSNSYGGILTSGGQKRAELYQGEYARSFGVFNEPDNFSNYYPSDTLWGLSNVKNVVGMWGTELQKHIIETYKIPVCIINGGSGGSSSEYNSARNTSNPASLETAYGRLLYRVQKAGLANDIKGFFYRQGENEADGATLTWKPNFEKIVENLKLDLPSIQKLYIFQNNIYTFPNNLSGVLRDQQRTMQLKYNNLTTIATIGTDDFDGIHYELKGHQQTGYEVFRIVAEDFYNKEKNINSKSPNITKAFYSYKTNNLTLQFEEGQIMQYPAPFRKNETTTIWIEEFLGVSGIQPYEIEGSADMNRISLKIKSNNIGNNVSYFPPFVQNGSYYNPYIKPVITNKWGMRALTFENFPINEALNTPLLTFEKENDKINLKWNISETSEEYIIERKTEYSTEYQTIARIKADDNLKYSDTLFDKSNNYFYRIKALNKVSESEYSPAQKVVFKIQLPEIKNYKKGKI